MTHTRKLRWWQCSLRSLLILVTLACIVSSIFAWRQNRQRRLVRLVESFNVAMDEQRYNDAKSIARVAHKELPSDPLTESMLEKADFARQVVFDQTHRGLDYHRGGSIYVQSGHPVADDVWKLGDAKKWEELSRTRKRLQQRSQVSAIR